MKKYLKILKLVVASVLMCSVNTVYSQQIVRGIVVDGKNKEPIAYASISVKGTDNIIITDTEGKFSVRAGRSDILVVAFIGYDKIEVPVDGKDFISIVMEDKEVQTRIAEIAKFKESGKDFLIENGVLKMINPKSEVVILPKNIKSISDLYCTNKAKVKKIIFPEGLKIIGNWAFYGYENIVEVIFNKDLVEIGERAFASCTNLKMLDLPNSLSIIGDDAFDDCELQAVRVHWKKEPVEYYWYNVEDCILIVPDGTKELYSTDASWEDFGKIMEEKYLK